MKLHMNLLHGSPRLARLAGTAALTAGLAGTMASGAPAASAGVNFPVINQKAVIGWGANTGGQLGNGVISEAQLTPVQVTGLSGVTKIAAGGTFSLALRKDRTVWAW